MKIELITKFNKTCDVHSSLQKSLGNMILTVDNEIIFIEIFSQAQGKVDYPSKIWQSKNHDFYDLFTNTC